MKTISVLGTEYKMIYGTAEDFEELKDMDGYTDTSTKTIIVDNMEAAKEEKGAKKDLAAYRRHVCRHEIMHAFLYESGLDASSGGCSSWATNEEMVDWFAIQSHKIQAAFKAAGCAEEE